MEELAGLRDTLRAEEQTHFEVVEERERLTKQLAEMDATLQVFSFTHQFFWRSRDLLHVLSFFVNIFLNCHSFLFAGSAC